VVKAFKILGDTAKGRRKKEKMEGYKDYATKVDK